MGGGPVASRSELLFLGAPFFCGIKYPSPLKTTKKPRLDQLMVEEGAKRRIGGARQKRRGRENKTSKKKQPSKPIWSRALPTQCILSFGAESHKSTAEADPNQLKKSSRFVCLLHAKKERNNSSLFISGLVPAFGMEALEDQRYTQ